MEGKPTGAIRLSFGLSSRQKDVHKILRFVHQHLIESVPPQPALETRESFAKDGLRVSGIWVYPIKSCRGVFQSTWKIGPNGFVFDREFALVNALGTVMTLKRYPQLAAISCSIDLEAGKFWPSYALTTDLLDCIISLPANG